MRIVLTVLLALTLATASVARAATPTVTATIATPGPPGGLAATDTSIWSSGRGQLSRIDPTTNTLALALPFDTLPWLAFGDGSLWLDSPRPAVGGDATTVTRADPVTGAPQATIGVGAAPTGFGFTPGAVWVANHHDGTVSRINPQTNTQVAVIAIEKPSIGGPQAVLGTPEGVWVGVPDMDAIVRIDPANNTVAEVLRVNACVCTSHLVQDADGGLWFGSDFHKNAVVHVWPHTHRVTWIPINGPGKPEDPAFTAGFVWVPTSTGDLAQIDPATDRVLSTTTIGGTLHFSTVAFGSLWLGDDAGNRILRVTTA
jgi:DNA-binding beta-propeller fold protein YncE